MRKEYLENLAFTGHTKDRRNKGNWGIHTSQVIATG